MVAWFSRAWDWQVVYPLRREWTHLKWWWNNFAIAHRRLAENRDEECDPKMYNSWLSNRDAHYITLVREVCGEKVLGTLSQLPLNLLLIVCEYADPVSDKGLWCDICPECYNFGDSGDDLDLECCPQCGLWNAYWSGSGVYSFYRCNFMHGYIYSALFCSNRCAEYRKMQLGANKG